MDCFNSTDVGCNVSWPIPEVEEVYVWKAPSFDVSVKNVVLAIVLTTLDIVTIFGNLLVLLAFVIERRLLQPFNLFILNLAVTDFLVAITAMTFYTIDTLLGYWPFGYVMCGVWIYVDFAMTFASVFTLVAISIDRFWCVTWVIQYKMQNSRFRTTIILLIIWACVIAIWTPPFIGDRIKYNEEYLCIWEPSNNREFVIFVAIVGHYIPCVIMVFCYFKVFYAMKRKSARIATHLTSGPGTSSNALGTIQVTVQSVHNKQQMGNTGPNLGSDAEHTVLNALEPPRAFTTNQSMSTVTNTTYLSATNASSASDNLHNSPPAHAARKPDSHGNQHHQRAPLNQTNNREKKLFVTLTYVLSCYLICWFPFYIAFDTYAWRPEMVPAELYTFFFWMTYVNSTLNPFIYAYTSREFRAAFVKVLTCIYRCKI